MSTYPMDAAQRVRRRADLRRTLVEAAHWQADRAGLTAKCAGSGMAVQHSTAQGGCANDGSNCLCECHDKREAA